MQMHRLTRAVLKFIYFEYNKRHDSVNYVDYNHYTRRSPYPLCLGLLVGPAREQRRLYFFSDIVGSLPSPVASG